MFLDDELKDLFEAPKELLIERPFANRRHVVILGAGASKQAFPNGDAAGNRIPLLDELVETICLGGVLGQSHIAWKGLNFEAVYSKLHQADPNSSVLKAIEGRIREYFGGFSLPNTASLYDFLVVSLQPKDLIATFNWDPFLLEAYERNDGFVPLPQIVHLHGCVALGYCSEHRVYGRVGRACPTCGSRLAPMSLLYPVEKKNYAADPLIKDQWNILRRALSEAYTVTIFGYGGPKTDREALEMLKRGWNTGNKRSWETSEIIDIRNEYELRNFWNKSVKNHSFIYTEDYFSSNIARHPRRSCEALYIPKIYGRLVEDFPLPRVESLQDLHEAVQAHVSAEQRLARTKSSV